MERATTKYRRSRRGRGKVSMRHVAESSAKEFHPPSAAPSAPGTGNPPCECGSFYSVGGHHHYHYRRHRRRRYHLLLFFVLFLFLTPLASPYTLSPSVPRRRNMAPRQEIRPSTPSLPNNPRGPTFSPTSPSHLPPDTSLSSLPPASVPPVAF